jgi:RNA polymerase sigma factor for flagellar operon FliA
MTQTTAPSSLADRRALAEQYMPYVRSLAGKVKKTVAQEIEYEDLVEYGMIGLLEAADRFDPSLGANFMTFAYYRIRGAIYDGLRGMGWMSRSAYTKARFAERANEYLAESSQAGAGSPALPDSADSPAAARPDDGSVEQPARELAQVVQRLAAVYITSLDAGAGKDFVDEAAIPAEERVGMQQARNLVRQTLKKLSTQERQLLELYYYKDMSLDAVGKQLGLSKSWTSRLHARVIEKLHRMLEDELG